MDHPLFAAVPTTNKSTAGGMTGSLYRLESQRSFVVVHVCIACSLESMIGHGTDT